MTKKCKVKTKVEVTKMGDIELTDVARQERNRYLREYSAKNKEKVKEINARYWAKRAAARKAEEEKNAQAT